VYKNVYSAYTNGTCKHIYDEIMELPEPCRKGWGVNNMEALCIQLYENNNKLI
jgi:hypothetical protein